MKKLMFTTMAIILTALTANGSTWQPMDSGTTRTLLSVWGTASDNVFAVGSAGTILHYDGNMWEQISSPMTMTVTVYAVSGSGPDDVYFVGHEGTGGMSTLLRYRGGAWQDPAAWETLPMPDVPYNWIFLEDIWVSGSHAFAVGVGADGNGHVVHWENGILLSHDAMHGPAGNGYFDAVWGRDPNDVYVSGRNGYSNGVTGLMYHYDGDTWSLWHPDGLGDHDLPKTRGIGGIWGTDDSPDLFFAGQSFSPWFAEVLYYDGTLWETQVFQESHTLSGVWASSSDDVYGVGYSGMILHGNNNFEWSIMDSGTTENLNGIWGTGCGDVFVVGDGGTILHLPEPPCGPDMVFIPGGEFEMGDHFGEGNADELPVHAVYISSFYMSRHEITNQQYCDYLNSAYDACDIKVDGGIVYASSDSSNSYPYCDTHGYDADSQIDYSGGLFSVRSKGGRNMSNDPMVEVSWYGAVAYCDFYGYRLPTEAEWEYAARGGLSGKRFPWGDTISHSQANYKADPSGYPYDVNPTSGFHPDWDDGIYPYTAPIGSFASNGYGLYDMGGNVWEWCNDWYDSNYYGVSPYDNPQGPPSGIYRILRGGTGHINADECRVADRGTYVPDRRYVDRGFRVARDAEPPEPVAFWPFDGDANDASGNGHDGTVHGATLCEDRCLVRDSAYCFDGEDDYIQVADAPLLDIDSDMTISAWVEPSEFDGNFFILWKHHYVISHVNDAYGLRITATDEVAFHFGPNSHETTSGYGLQRGHWTHVAVTFDDATDELIFYKNGQFHQRVSTSRSINTNNSPLFIQGFYHHESGWNCFPGTVDELRIYDRALSACEIHELIENCSPIADAGGPYIEYATSWFGADVGLDGTNSNDPDGDAITYEWELDLSVDSDGDGDPCNDVDATDPAPESFFPIGQTDIALVVIDEHGLRSERDTTNVTVSFIEVAIDIKPGSFPNAINMGSNGVVPVAFLTDLGFDASTVDPATVTLRGEDFADGLVKLRGKKDAPAPMASLEDVDADGDLDLVVHLETEKLAEHELQAICEIGALTYDGYVVSGSDTIHVVPE
jgi:formylglycine-generating enzyme required for sulfatase activity